MHIDNSLELFLMASTTMIYKRLVLSEVISEMKSLSGLNETQLLTLVFILLHAEASMSDIANDLGLENSSFTTVAAKLLERGLINKTVSPEDRRKHLLTLTKSGMTLAATAFKAHVDSFNSKLARLSESERELLFESVENLHSMLIKMGGGAR